MKRVLATILGVCKGAGMLAGCGTASDSAGSTAAAASNTSSASAGKSANFEAKAAGIYLMSPAQTPLRLNLYFKGSDVPYVSLEEWMGLHSIFLPITSI